MKKMLLFSVFTLISMWIILSSRSGGLAAVGNQDNTGRPGTSNCGSCHGGGSFGTSASIQVLDNNIAISTYFPGQTYTLRVTYSSSTGNPVGFGSQTVAVLSSNTNTNAGNLGNVVSSNTQISNLQGRQYLEQQQLNSSGVFEVSWTAPSSGSGNVNFYSSGFAANGNGATSGDQATTATLTLSEGNPCNSFTANELINNVSCNGGNDGSITLNPGGGTAPYSYIWSNSATTSFINNLTAGNYSVTITDNLNCTDNFSFNVTAPAALGSTLNESICLGDSFLSATGKNYFSSGTYFDTLTAGNNCDSIITLNLTTVPPFNLQALETLCEGEVFLLPNGDSVLTDTSVILNFQSILGCDSVINLQVSFLNLIETPISLTLCEGDSTTLPNGTVVKQAGTYRDTLVAGTSCDSVIVYEIGFTTADSSNFADTICAGLNYTLPNGDTVDSGGTYHVTLNNLNGCDSIVTVNLYVHENNMNSSIELIVYAPIIVAQDNSLEATYRWLYCEDNNQYSIIENQTTDTLWLSVEMAATANAVAFEITKFNCVDTSECINIEGLIGLDELKSSQNQFKLFPNPAQNELILELQVDKVNKYEFTFIDLQGRQVKRPFQSNQILNRIDVSDLQSGVYFVQIQIEKAFQILKFIKSNN